MWKNIWRGLVLCAGIPIMCEANANHSFAEWMLGMVVLFLGAPFYFLGVLAIYCIAAMINYSLLDAPENHLWFALNAIAIVGYLWVGTKILWTVKEAKEEQERQERNLREQEDEERKRLETEKTARQAENRERARFCAENSAVFAGIADLLSTCVAPAMEMMRAAGAMEGTDIEMDPKVVVWMDVGFILVPFSKTGSQGDAYIERLWSAVTRTIEPPDVDGVPPLFVITNRGVKQLGMIVLLAAYDKAKRTNLSARAASTYLSIVSAVAAHCDGSLAAKVVADEYIRLLSPFIHESRSSEYARDSSRAGSQSSRMSACAECVKGYQLLDLSFGASKDEVKQKRDALAQVLHSDHTGGMSKRTRDTAEEQLKSINVAYGHILKCRFSGINGSEPPPAPPQSKSATTVNNTTEHQPAPASSDASETVKQENRNKVPTDEELIEALDATRKKVEATTKKMEEFLEQMKKRRHTSLERF